MTAWILITLIWTGQGGLDRMDSVRFDDQKACEAAKTAVTDNVEFKKNLRVLCMPAASKS